MSGGYYDDDAYDDIIAQDSLPSSPYRAYLEASRTPFTALLFTLPLFAAYHFGYWWMRTYESQNWANAAEVYIALAVERLGWAGPLLAFIIVLVVFSVRQHLDNVPWRPPPTGTFGLMAIESLVFAIPVIALYHVMDTLTRWLSASLEGAASLSAILSAWQTSEEPAAGGLSVMGKIALSCGAGVYEEFLFRLLLMGFLAWCLRTVFDARGSGMRLIAALTQAAVFSAFHHLPGSPEPFTAGVFAFRMAAGVYFAYLYWERGFGIAAGAHAAYDLITVIVWP